MRRRRRKNPGDPAMLLAGAAAGAALGFYVIKKPLVEGFPGPVAGIPGEPKEEAEEPVNAAVQYGLLGALLGGMW